jgi:hypothetical protein
MSYRLVLSLPNSDEATAVWTNEQLKEVYIAELRKVYREVVLLVGNDAVRSKWWQYNQPDVIFAGVGHGNSWLYTGQNLTTIMSITDVQNFIAFAFCPVSCSVWEGGRTDTLCGRLAQKGTPIVIGETDVYQLTDTGVRYYVRAENKILLGLLQVKSTDDLEKLKNDAYEEQIKEALKNGDPLDASILEDDMKNRKVQVNQPPVPPAPPQPTESYITLWFYDENKNKLKYVTVTREDNNEVHNTNDTNWTVFRVPYGNIYKFKCEKEGYETTEVSVNATKETISVEVIMRSVQPPTPPQPPQPPPAPPTVKYSGSGSLEGEGKGGVWIASWGLPITINFNGITFKYESEVSDTDEKGSGTLSGIAKGVIEVKLFHKYEGKESLFQIPVTLRMDNVKIKFEGKREGG